MAGGLDLTEYFRQYEQPWQPDFAARLAAAPESVQGWVQARLTEGKTWPAMQEQARVWSEALLSASPEELRALTGVLFPQFPELAARAYRTVLETRPYTRGLLRRAFRAGAQGNDAERGGAAAGWLWSLWTLLRAYPEGVLWVAEAAGLFEAYESRLLGPLLAQAVSEGDAGVLQLLKDTASTQHPVARMGRHVPQALLGSDDPQAWEYARQLLLAAQRQEGLRQVILETVDEAHPGAFPLFLNTVLDEDLLRFAAVLRAACVWYGLGYDVTDMKKVRQLLTLARGYLEDAAQVTQAVSSGSGEEVYMALYTLGMRDADEAAALARPLLTDPDPARRMAAAQFLSAAHLLQSADLARLLADEDLRLGAVALAPGSYPSGWVTPENTNPLTFDALRAYAERLSRAPRHDPLLFPWLGDVPDRASVTDGLVAVLPPDELGRIVPHLGELSPGGKSFLLARLRALAERRDRGETVRLPDDTRFILLTLLQDRSSATSQEAVTTLTALRLELSGEERTLAHDLLRRKSADLRRGLIRLLAADPAQGAASAAALLALKSTEQRQAGLQLLEEVGGLPPADFQPKNVSEATLLAKLAAPESQLTLNNGLGLFDPQDLSQPQPPRPSDNDFVADVERGAELLRSLDDFLAEHAETPVSGTGWDGETTELLTNLSPYWLSARVGRDMPLAGLWNGWWAARAGAQEGDLTRMAWALGHRVDRTETTETELLQELSEGGDTSPEQEHARLLRQRLIQQTLHAVLGPPVPLKLDRAPLIEPVLDYLSTQELTEVDTGMQLDAWESALSRLPSDTPLLKLGEERWQVEDPRSLLGPLVLQGIELAALPAEQFQQLWRVQLHHHAAFPNLPRLRMSAEMLILAERAGLANRADLLDLLIGERNAGMGDVYYGNSFDDLRSYTRRKLSDLLPTSPAWMQAVNDARDRVLAVELERGDLETPATLPALALQSVSGAARTLRLLAGLGKQPLRRGYSGHSLGKDATFSHLLRVSFPDPGDTAQTVREQAKTLGLSDPRLLDLAMFAPQWAELVSGAVGWKGLADGVYWLHAHTRDSQWSVPTDIREAWEAEISERTPLRPTDLTEGAVDVAWFRRMHRALGRAHFQTLLGAAKYASSSGGHKRAELFAAAILGEVPEDTLLARIREKRNQDAVRALGLLPLPKGKKAAQVLEARYLTLVTFRRETRQFGAQRQASERLAADIGLQNLARSAGYADPQRLMWAMEARMAPDWQQVVTADGVTVSAELDGAGAATLLVRRGEKPLKTLPPALRKNPEVLALREAVKDLAATRTRMRAALEEAMVRGDHFTPQELRDLARHPIIAPMLGSLVWVLGEGPLGFWEDESLRTLTGELPLGDQALRLAHPHDLFTGGQWREYQAAVLKRQLTQPFKQVFREYYPLTAAEKTAQRSVRYEGHHVQPVKAAALLKARGWVSIYDEGTRKTFHDEGLSVWIDDALSAGTPNEVEGLPLHAAYFMRVGEAQPLPLAAVPPRLFSQVLRDLDLVVSVAHVGGVDPEASQSTVEMRESLLRETLRLLKLKNVRLEHGHALIDGHHSRYSVHLGSGTVHRQPGGFLCIVPVHNQAQGRLFLPFADPDPRTAEVVSKVLLLAEDRKIQDPTILEQLR
jgi:hypothetical protein